LKEAQNFCPRCGADLRGLGSGTDTLSGPWLGRLIDNRYRVLEKLGEGGMGAVFRVEHVRMGKTLALKLLRRELANDKNVVLRFEQEARIVSKLSHPNTVSVFDFGETDDKSLFMAMEYVPGKDLGTLALVEGKLPEKRAIGIAVQVLHSLAEAHEAGIVHRDVKPGNVMVVRTRQGGDFVKVVDFGIAKLAKRDEKGKAITGIADFIGTPNYVSPEQARGDPPDARSDLYSLGSMLFEVVAGRPLFEAPTPLGVVAKHLEEEPPLIGEVVPDHPVSEAFEGILRKSLAKSAKDRFQSADEMRRALEVLAQHQSIPLDAPGSSLDAAISVDTAIARRGDWDAFERKLRRGRMLRATVAVGVILFAIAGGFLAVRRSLADPSRIRAPVTEEQEPNDTFLTANLIRPGDEVRGTIGKRISDEVSDQDHYEFAVDGPSAKAARISVTGVPNVNIVVELFAAESKEGRLDFRQLAKVDDQPVGEGPEVMDDLRLKPGRYLVRVRDGRRPEEAPGSPRENSSDPYVLKVDLAEPGRYDEIEPNNTPDDLHRLGIPAIDSNRPVFGHAGLHAIRQSVGGAFVPLWSDDYFAFTLPAGATHACVVLGGIPEAVLRLVIVAADGVPTPATQFRPVSVAGGEVVTRCAPATLSLLARVDMDSGSQDKVRYALATIDDAPGGFASILAANEDLAGAGRSQEGRILLGKAIDAMPRAPGAADARKVIGATGADLKP
jgi:eukaryotic-like serine/threonine-protein kinase